MKKREQENSLFEAWRTPDGSAAQKHECPSDAEIFDAVMLKIPLERRREIVLHTARCSACAESWRLAIELKPPADVVGLASRRSKLPSRGLPAWGLAAAAGLALVIGVFWIAPTQDPGFPEINDSTTLRGDVEYAIELETPEGTRLLADDFELRWRPNEAIEEYRILITTADLENVFSGSTRTTSLRVPSSVLSSIEAGEPLYWYVSAIREDGSIVRSSTQTVFVEPAVNSE